MSSFQRYAIYYLPDDRDLADFGATWLGWDVRTGKAKPHFAVDDIEDFTATPQKYGFHGTLKPPFALGDSKDEAALRDAIHAFAARKPPIALDGLAPTVIGHFLALVPEGPVERLAQFAFDCVRAFDEFRRPADTAELERRRAAGLTQRQNALLKRWGYPFVADEFRFHLTLTGRLDEEQMERAKSAALQHLPALPRPFRIDSISLAGERPDGRFQEIRRYALSG